MQSGWMRVFQDIVNLPFLGVQTMNLGCICVCFMGSWLESCTPCMRVLTCFCSTAFYLWKVGSCRWKAVTMDFYEVWWCIAYTVEDGSREQQYRYLHRNKFARCGENSRQRCLTVGHVLHWVWEIRYNAGNIQVVGKDSRVPSPFLSWFFLDTFLVVRLAKLFAMVLATLLVVGVHLQL